MKDQRSDAVVIQFEWMHNYKQLEFHFLSLFADQ